MSGEATALEHLPSKVLWYILLGRKDLDDCTVALPWKRSPSGYQRLLATPRGGVLSPASFCAQVLLTPEPLVYEVRVDVPNRNQHHKGGVHGVEEAMAYADGVLTRYGVPLLEEQT
jgi:hypothetical protein